MSLWNKIVVGVKFLFVGFESATDYILKLLSAFLCTDGVSESVQNIRGYVETALGYMRKYGRFCPACWVTHYEKLIVAIQTFSDAFADNQITLAEMKKAKSDLLDAISEWMKD